MNTLLSLPLPPIITEHSTLIIGLLLGLVFIYYIFLHLRLRRLTKGTTGGSLEAIINTALARAQEIQKENSLIRDHALSLDTRVSHSLRNAQVIRYKALETGGSNQSFSVALLNEQGSGVVITSLYVRERVNTFAKPVEKYTSTYDLTEEELSVIRDAKKAHVGK